EWAWGPSRGGSSSPAGPSARGRREGVALADLARIQPRAEPAHPLLGAAVGEGLGGHVAARLLLDAVVADGGGSLEPRLHVAGIEEIPSLRVEAPHAGKAIGLELQ